MSKKCSSKSKHMNDPNYVCNTKSGRWVHKDGPTGKKVIESTGNKVGQQTSKKVDQSKVKKIQSSTNSASIITDKIMNYSDILKQALDRSVLGKYISKAVKSGIDFNTIVHDDINNNKAPIWEMLIINGNGGSPIWFGLSEESKNKFSSTQRDLIDDVNEYIHHSLKSIDIDID